MLGLTTWLIWLAAAYLAGSVPFGLLIGLAQGLDIRKLGSGNLGATNTGRVLGRRWGIICFGLDTAKGLAPVLAYGLASGVMDDAGSHPAIATGQWFMVAAAAVLGHVFPLWLRFKGGKGVATALGALLGVYPALTGPGAVAVGVWLAVVMWTGYPSAASISAAVVLPILAILNSAWIGKSAGEIAVIATGTILLTALVIARHRTNIARLRAGTEARVSWSRKSGDEQQA